MADPGAHRQNLKGIEMWRIQAKRQAVKPRESVSWPQTRTEHEKGRGLRLGSGETSGMSRAREKSVKETEDGWIREARGHLENRETEKPRGESITKRRG